LIPGLEHFGNTAVPDLSAKPIIDILIAVRSLAAAQASFVEHLRKLDYVWWAENPKADLMFFVKGMPPFGPRRTHHVHVTEIHGEMSQRLAFRDWLRAHPKEARSYGSSNGGLQPSTRPIARPIPTPGRLLSTA